MKKIKENIFKNHNRIFQLTIIFIFSIIIALFVSDKTIHSFDFEEGTNWNYDDLYSDFDYSIIKSEDEIKKNKEAIELFSDVYYDKDTLVFYQALLNLELDLKSAFRSKSKVLKYYEIGELILSKIYSNGIIDLRKKDLDKEDVYIISDEFEKYNSQNAKKIKLSNLLSMDDAILIIKKEIESFFPDNKFLIEFLIKSINYDINFNSYYTNLVLDQAYEKISYKKGLVKEGDLIVSKNQFIDSETNQKLYSYKRELSNYINNKDFISLFLGNFLISIITLGLCFLFLLNFYKDLLTSNASFLLIFFIILFFVVLSVFVTSFNSSLIYALPFCVIPLTLRAFFDFKLSLFVYIFSLIIISFLVDQSQLFFVINFFGGLVALLSPEKIYTQSKLLFTIFRVLIVYIMVFISVSLLLTGSFDNINLLILWMLILSSVLTFLTFPFIFVCEKVFKLVSDLSLLEYADTNTDLLRTLAKDAPGTFHHSLQVSHLSESVAIEIGANPLLVRAGALYHDIGKLNNPNFFIENQSGSSNPHDDLSFDESAKLIINHVLDGIELAKKHNLPEQLIDFIRTHHGDSLMQYFYKEYLKNFPEKVNDKDFRYPGPKPYNKETAILMMCDSVEAASRSLNKIDNNSINEIVDKVISSQFEQNQYDNSSLTFKEINQIKKTLKLKLKDIHHTRITYTD